MSNVPRHGHRYPVLVLRNSVRMVDSNRLAGDHGRDVMASAEA